MKHVLLLSYYFPPLGMGGTQRILGFAKYLPQFGWQPTVVTVKSVQYYAQDSDLQAMAADVTVERTGSLDPLRVLQNLSPGKAATPKLPASWYVRWLRRAADFLLLPDNKILWAPFAYARAHRLMRARPFDAVLSSGPPHSTHLLAQRLAQKFDVPWVADFRDTWAGGDFQPTATPVHRLIDSALQGTVLRSASHVTVVSSGLLNTLTEAAAPRRLPATVITNGYEENDFRGGAKRGSRFDVVHVGSIGNYAQPESALLAFKQFIVEAGLSPEAAQLCFVGADLTGTLADHVSRLNLQAYVEHTGYVPHRQAVQRLRRASLLLYLVAGNPSRGFVPGKTFEYLAAQRPVLALAQGVEGLAILQAACGAIRHVPPDRPDAAVLALKAFFAEHRKGVRQRKAAIDVRRFSRRNLTGQMAAILEQVTPASRVMRPDSIIAAERA